RVQPTSPASFLTLTHQTVWGQRFDGWLPSRLIPHRHRPRAELQPAHELQVDTLRQPREQRRTASPRSPRTSSAFRSTWSRVLDTTYFFAASIVRANGSIQSGLAPAGAGRRHPASIISYVTRPKRRASACALFSTA